MKTKELIEELQVFNPETEVGFYLNPTKDKEDKSCYDVPLKGTVLRNEDCPNIIYTLDKSKFDTITSLLETSKEEIDIKINNKGIYVFSDGKLIREIERCNKCSKQEMSTAPEEYIKMLLKII